jgi:hypothetical protein
MDEFRYSGAHPRPGGPKPTKVAATKLPLADADKLEQIVRAERMTVSEAIREFINTLLKRAGGNDG